MRFSVVAAPLITIALYNGTCISAAEAVETVPFVGCVFEGMSTVPAPTGEPVVVDLPHKVAAQLAFYQAENTPGVLAPRGWKCAATGGTAGSFLVVAPDVDPSLYRGDDNGPTVVTHTYIGGTSGRFEAGRILALAFPDKAKKRVAELVAENAGWETKDFPFGPIPGLRRVANNRVEFHRPAGKALPGISAASSKASDGVIVYLENSGESLDSLELSLPRKLKRLHKPITQLYGKVHVHLTEP
jgi:hypothetical protein